MIFKSWFLFIYRNVDNLCLWLFWNWRSGVFLTFNDSFNWIFWRKLNRFLNRGLDWVNLGFSWSWNILDCLDGWHYWLARRLFSKFVVRFNSCLFCWLSSWFFGWFGGLNSSFLFFRLFFSGFLSGNFFWSERSTSKNRNLRRGVGFEFRHFKAVRSFFFVHPFTPLHQV